MPNQEQIEEQIEKHIKDALDREGFISAVGLVDEFEEAVLIILTHSNTAQRVRTIRNNIIEDNFKKYKFDIYKKIFPTVKKSMEDILYKEQDAGEDAFNKMSIEIKKFRNSKDALIVEALYSDDDLIRMGFKPLSYTKRMRAYEVAIRSKQGITVPAWNAIKEAVETLERLKLVESRPSGRKEDVHELYYYIKPSVYSAYLKGRDGFYTKKDANKSYHPDKREIRWYMDRSPEQ